MTYKMKAEDISKGALSHRALTPVECENCPCEYALLLNAFDGMVQNKYPMRVIHMDGAYGLKET